VGYNFSVVVRKSEGGEELVSHAGKKLFPKGGKCDAKKMFSLSLHRGTIGTRRNLHKKQKGGNYQQGKQKLGKRGGGNCEKRGKKKKKKK